MHLPTDILLTPRALAHFKTVLHNEEKAVRIKVIDKGCSGLAHVIEPCSAACDDDLVFPFETIKIIIDKKSFVYLKGLELDYKEEGLNSHIKFNNPNVKNECGCGESFSVNKT